MKVILLSNIEKVGKQGEIVSVRRGFARNYLVPRDLAIYATPQNMKKLGAIQSQAAEEEQKRLAELNQLAARISALNLVFVRKVDDNEHMFGSVSETDIVHQLAERGIDIHKTAVLLDKHIKELGEIVVPVRLHKDIVADLKLTVEKEIREDATKAEVPIKEEETAELEIPADELEEQTEANEETTEEIEVETDDLPVDEEEEN
jgi:large subunit ribosomal protein L9